MTTTTSMPRRITVLAETGDTVTISHADFETLLDALEDAGDLAVVAANRAHEARVGWETARASYLTAEEYKRLRGGASPILVWREKRGLTQAQLAERAGVGQGYLSEIERRRKPGSADALRKLAAALGVSMDVLMPPGMDPAAAA